MHCQGPRSRPVKTASLRFCRGTQCNKCGCHQRSQKNHDGLNEQFHAGVLVLPVRQLFQGSVPGDKLLLGQRLPNGAVSRYLQS